MELTEQQEKEAIALYKHLIQHPEVQGAPINPGMPMCKLCDKTAEEILNEGDYEGRRHRALAEKCPHCKMDIAIRNPSGFCDHLHYPDYCEECKKITTTEMGGSP